MRKRPRRHTKRDEGQSPVAGSRPHVPPDRFKHAAPSTAPRWSSLLALAWGGSLFAAVIRYVQGINGWDIDRWDAHYIVDGFTYTVMLILVSLLWSSWEREEKYPELLPQREFDRRYPPGPGTPPEREYHRRIPYVEDVTDTGSVMSARESGSTARIEPGHADPAIIRNSEGDKKYERSAREAAERWNADHPDSMFRRDHG